MAASNAKIHLYGTGKAVVVTVNEAVLKGELINAQGWIGIAAGDASSGQSVALIVDNREYQFTVPAALTVNKGDIVYIDKTAVAVNHPTDAAWSTSAGANRVALFKATADKDTNNVVTGIMLANASLAS